MPLYVLTILVLVPLAVNINEIYGVHVLAIISPNVHVIWVGSRETRAMEGMGILDLLALVTFWLKKSEASSISVEVMK
jgi:hypothetical protein